MKQVSPCTREKEDWLRDIGNSVKVGSATRPLKVQSVSHHLPVGILNGYFDTVFRKT